MWSSEKHRASLILCLSEKGNITFLIRYYKVDSITLEAHGDPSIQSKGVPPPPTEGWICPHAQLMCTYQAKPLLWYTITKGSLEPIAKGLGKWERLH